MENLKFLIQSAPSSKCEIIIVQDLAHGESASELLQPLRDNSKVSITLLKGFFGSPGQTRNRGLLSAKGNWVAFCDADDRQYFDSVISEIERDGTPDLIVGQFNRVTKDKKLMRSVKTRSLEDLWTDPGFWRIAYKKSSLFGIKFTDLKIGEDIVFMAEVLRRSPKVSFRDALFYDYTIGSSLQITSNVANFGDLPKAIETIKIQNPNWRITPSDAGLIVRLSVSWLNHCVKQRNLRGFTENIQNIWSSPWVLLFFLKRKLLGKGGN